MSNNSFLLQARALQQWQNVRQEKWMQEHGNINGFVLQTTEMMITKEIYLLLVKSNAIVA